MSNPPNMADPGSAEVLSPADFELLMDDRRDFHVPTIEKVIDGKKKKVAYEPAERPWKTTTGITLHQTACDMGESLERYDGIGAHFSITRRGRIRRHADNNRVVYHGNGWNSRCVGIEVNGRYSGREDDPKTAVDEALQSLWDDPSTKWREQPMDVTPESMLALRQLIRWICWDVARNGGRVTVLNAHRQSSVNRRNDPGETIWKQAAIPLHSELGLTDGGVGFEIGGFPIPECWDPRCVGFKY